MNDNEQKVSLPKVYLESILLSIKDKQTYKEAISKLKSFHLDKNSRPRILIDRYTYLVEQQLKGEIPTKTTLINALGEVQGFNLKDKDTFDDSEVLSNLELYIKREERSSLASRLYDVPTQILDYGVTDDITQLFEEILSTSSVDRTYVPITKTFKELYSNKEDFDGLSFLCPELDKRTGGMCKGTLAVVLGAPGSMKTTSVVNICYNAAKEGMNVAYLSLEESPMQLYSKILSRVSIDVGKPISTEDIVTHKLSESDEKILFDEVVPYFDNLPGKFYIIGEQDLGNYNFSTIENKLADVDALALEETQHGIDIVVVDHIQILKYAVDNKDESSAINMYVSFFRQQSLSFLHKKRQINIILLSQANREGYYYAQKHDGQYLMQHVAEASEIERAASYIISVYTDPMVQFSKLLKMGAIKLRNSALPMDTINIFADGEHYQVGETATPEQKDYSVDDLGLGMDISTPTPGTDDILAEFNL